MFRQIDERTIVVEQTPQVPMFADRPEPVRREPIKLTKAALLKRQRWTEEDFEIAVKHGLPNAAKRTTLGAWGWTLIWSDIEIDNWIENTLRKNRGEIDRLLGDK